MNLLLLSCAAGGAAFLAGVCIGLLMRCHEARRPRAAGPFDIDWRPQTACDVEGEDPLFV